MNEKCAVDCVTKLVMNELITAAVTLYRLIDCVSPLVRFIRSSLEGQEEEK